MKKDKDETAEDDEEDEPRIKKNLRSPKKKGGVLAGRIIKANAPAKPRGKGAKGVKEEPESSTSSMMDQMLGGVSNGFGGLCYNFDGHDAFGVMGMDVDGDFDGANV